MDEQVQASMFDDDRIHEEYFYHCPYCPYKGVMCGHTVAHMRLEHQDQPKVEAWHILAKPEKKTNRRYNQ